MDLILQLIAGAVGGNAAGMALKNLSLGPIINSVLGVLGGGIGGQIIGALGGGAMAGMANGGTDAASIIASLASGGVGGAVLMALGGVVKNMMAKS